MALHVGYQEKTKGRQNISLDVIAGPSRTATHAHAQGHGTQSVQTAAGAGHGAPVRQIFDPDPGGS